MPCCTGGQIKPKITPSATAENPVTIGTNRRPPKNARYSGSLMSLKRLYSAPAIKPLAMPASMPMLMLASITLRVETITR
ncbi:hypothetical protein QF039_000281 [Pseudomonas sp. W2I6]|nr:hypothetical protein [Pseudomonas sp. W2I6]